MKALNAALVGVGRMGANHARILAEMEGVNLKAVCDADKAAAEKIARKYFVPAHYRDIQQMVDTEELDAVVIATPTTEHRKAAKICIEKKLHVFLEKPMATTVEECREIIEQAKSSNVKVMIGHIERFNPVILQLRSFLSENFLGDIYYIETVRSGPFPKRLYGSKDGVVIDLAVHDLDLVDYLFGRLNHIYAQHIQTDSHNQDIYARVMFKTKKGILGSSEFSWISPRKERSISIYGDKGLLVGNLMDQEVWFFENGDVGIDYSDNYYQNALWGRVSEGKVIKFPIKREEPLKAEHDYFFSLVRGEKEGKEGFGLDYGKMAVEYSQGVLSSAARNEIIYFN